jgi:hypothetical protein
MSDFEKQLPSCPTTTIATSSKSLAKPDRCTPPKDKNSMPKNKYRNMHAAKTPKIQSTLIFELAAV